jgi:transcription elongation factor GreB
MSQSERSVAAIGGEQESAALAQGVKNYITPQGYARLKNELTQLLDAERPELVKVISWAASNGDRSENGDYIYGKKRLREIDRRIHFLNRRLDSAVVVDPAARSKTDQVFFGATVSYVDGGGEERTVTIVGMDEVDPGRGHVSWISPVAKALLKKREGDEATVRTPAGPQHIEIINVCYEALA